MEAFINSGNEKSPLADFVVLGFPKCGTTALMDALGALEGVGVDQFDGRLEAPFFESLENVEKLKAAHAALSVRPAVVGHKYVVYMYSEPSLRRIVELVPRAPLIVCVRDPMRALLSWRQMHRRIAQDGKYLTHFVNASPESRAFYKNASLDAYYQRFARTRLGYEANIRRLTSLAEHQKIVIVSQEFMANRMADVLTTLAKLIGIAKPTFTTPHQPHRGFADRAELPVLAAETLTDIKKQRSRLARLLAELRSQPRVTLLVD